MLGEEASKVHNETLKIYQEAAPFDPAHPHAIDCYVNSQKIMHWLGVNRINTPYWSNPYNLNQEYKNFNLLGYQVGQNCLYNWGQDTYSAFCIQNRACGVCDLPSDQIVYLKGLCPDNIDRLYDVQYYIDGIRNGRPYFR